ncbi:MULTISPECIES: hypothetical protein [Haloferacaceae]|uniref:Uncharacterized protein n=1 Tax=Halorubrum glutamatedens TaxID=2707018 RepID=A0ABD5QMR5_9EURY|nr:hypothetical protein [Halobellus captivus]
MSQNDRTSRFIDAEGPNEDAVELAFAWLHQLGDQHEDKRDAVLAVNTKKQLDGVISTVIGEQAAKALDKKNPVGVGEAEIQLMTKRIDPSGWQSGPVLAIYPDKDLLDKIDGMHGVTDVLVVPWSKDEVQYWIDTWGASALRSDASGSSPDLGNSIVEEALETLDLLVNTSTGITHPSDRSTCIEIFKTLHNERISFDPDAVRAWLVAQKHWDPDDADDVKEISEGVQDGKGFQYESGRLSNDIMEQWEEQANED